jgi:hypothetical protein
VYVFAPSSSAANLKNGRNDDFLVVELDRDDACSRAVAVDVLC